MNISVIGLGKLGLPWFSLLIENGFNVIGVDKNIDLINMLKKQENPYFEDGLDDFLNKYDNLYLTNNIRHAVENTEITFVVVPTPSGKDGRFSNYFIIDVLTEISKSLKNKKGYHLIVISSTVMPTSFEKEFKPFIEKNAGKKCSIDFGLCYNPEFIALGEVGKGMIYPDMVLIGESDKKAGDTLEGIYKKVCKNNPPIKRMKFNEAEICKIAVNSFITMKISYANMIGELCDRIENAQARVITEAIGCDSRIGKKYISPGGKYGGPCFPRDNIAFSKFFEDFNVIPDLLYSTETINKRQTSLIFEKIQKVYKKGMSIGIAGISYKEKTDITEESQGLELLYKLIVNGFDSINIYNFGYPCKLDTKSLNNSKIKLFDDENGFIDKSDIIIKILRESFKIKFPDNKILIDIWER